MNQLWVRISLTFVGILLFLILIPMIFALTIQSADVQWQGQVREVIQEVQAGALRHILLTRTLRFLILFSLIGTLVGVITSRSLSAPLGKLAEAARAIGSRELGQRIEVKGTEEVRQVTRAFNDMAADLEKAETLRSNMLADVAHELRTPISVIQGNLRAILDGVYEMDKAELAQLYDQTRQLSRLVDDLHELALAEADLLQLEESEVNLNDLVKDVASVYAPLLEENEVKLDLELPDHSPEIIGDRTRLNQCFSNLLNNAIRYTPPGGRITVELSFTPNWAHLSVADTGIGIASKHLPYIFDRFYRVDSARNRETGGTGLGLAITQALVKAHGGEITVESAGENDGSKFTLILPRQSHG